jgi:hypothetical protein
MSFYDYDAFRITLSVREDGDFNLVASSAVHREPTGVGRLPRSLEELGRMEASRAVRLWDHRADALDVGSKLAAALFVGEVADSFERALEDSRSRSHGLRIELSIGAAPSLVSVPWELLYRAPIFLCSHRMTPVVRLIQVARGERKLPALDGVARMLAIVSSPKDLPAIDCQRERANLERVIHPLIDAGRAELEWLEPATPRGLRLALRDRRWDLLHFVGHGMMGSDGEAALLLEDPHDGRAALVGCGTLGSAVDDQRQLRLIVLDPPDDGTVGENAFAAAATTLIQRGASAVVSMQFEMSDDARGLVAEELYGNLLGRGLSLDAALAEARKALLVEVGGLAWASPSLYLQHAGGETVSVGHYEEPGAELRARGSRLASTNTSARTTRSFGLKMFVSYRRDDAADVTGRICDWLRFEFGNDSVFQDVDDIEPGLDFRTVLREALDECDVLLAVIGRAWLEATDQRGTRRIDNESDFVHLEIATALERGLPVIPLLVSGATMPESRYLPPALQSLSYRQGLPIRPNPEFKADMARLMNNLAKRAQTPAG